ncbi:LD-carboxypeptidase [Dyadobacter sp. LHD-138]|uniref:S66 peptidase family protein n=1 Tax=Dyadobacter sp. LHD-138 TaxID=3071413 RepID=UPI0027E0A5D3|nr:LD-carboxypeptidase [Dyadobacter sp. LHD-138]MDQ6477387.1 LD-carboxypeptidase [Dyadobacter sp. LHD-138]
MPTIQIPPFLQSGDKIGIVAPASCIRYEDILPGISLLRDQWKLKIVEGKTLKSAYNQFSATDAERLEDLQTMLDDSSIKAVIAARGGYGCSRIIDNIDFTNFIKSPKWIVGFSDLTVVLTQLYQLGYAGIHAPMVKSMTLEGAEKGAESLRQLLFGELPGYSVPPHAFNKTGSVVAEMVGGNLCILTHLIGSPTQIDTEGKILFIEDVNEYLYNLDRMMIQLKRAGKLSHLAGLIVGQFTDMRDNSSPSFGKTAYEIIHEHVAEYDYPVSFDFPVGHVADNRAIGVGMNAYLDVNNDGVELHFLSSAPTII